MENDKAAAKIAKKIQDEIVKSLNGLPTPEEKYSVLLKRCVEAEKVNKSLLMSQKQNQKLLESLQLDHNHALNTKSKLESLCRELQKQNKSIKEESLSKIKEEEIKRKETQEKFQKSLNEIQTMMNENTAKNDKLKQDNLEMSSKFKYILEQYDQREQQMDKINKQMELVTQLNEAKLAKSKVEMQAEREKHSKEVAILEDTIKILKQQLTDAIASEKCLKEQVEMYSGKYGEFQESLKRSQDVFEGYKTDMTKMSKKTVKAEKEMLSWKSKFEKSNALLLDLVSEKQVKDEHITKTARQMFLLEKLCRQLQAERTAFFNALKENNLEIPVVKEVSKDEIKIPKFAEEPPKTTAPDKLETMTEKCANMKKELADLEKKLVVTGASTASNSNKNTKKSDKANKKAKKDKAKAQKEQNGNEAESQIETEPPADPSTVESEVKDNKNVIENGAKEVVEPPAVVETEVKDNENPIENGTKDVEVVENLEVAPLPSSENVESLAAN